MTYFYRAGGRMIPLNPPPRSATELVLDKLLSSSHQFDKTPKHIVIRMAYSIAA